MIKKIFTDNKGKTIKIKNYNFKKIDELKWALANCKSQIFSQECDEFNSLQGFDVYDSPYDKDSSFKIYLEAFYNPRFTTYDAEVIEKLNKQKGTINLTDFPKGIITIDNRIIGQEIPKHEGYVPFQPQKLNELELTNAYLKIIEILEELLQNEIIYTDIKPSNFLINNEGIIKLINFEKFKLWFEQDGYHNVNTLINNLKLMIMTINGKTEIPVNYKDADSLEEIKKRTEEAKSLLKK